MHHTSQTAKPAGAVTPLEDLAAVRVADLAREHPASIRVFQRHRIDFCCGGRRSIGEAAGRAGVDRAILIGELEATLASPGARQTWLCALPESLADLCKMIVGRYHVELRAELPRLAAMAARVEEAHGAQLPRTLPALAATLRALAAELDSHMREEEEVVFPAIERLERAANAHRAAAPNDLAALVTAREDEHAAAGEHLRTLRRLTSDYTPPEWACNSFRGLYHGLRELERDLHEHIHLENNILFPRALDVAAHVVA